MMLMGMAVLEVVLQVFSLLFFSGTSLSCRSGGRCLLDITEQQGEDRHAAPRPL